MCMGILYITREEYDHTRWYGSSMERASAKSGNSGGSVKGASRRQDVQ
ncbi:MAG: hypothetical protein MJY79_00030 [Bacteroidaceae bacterium]|nr:hypothetical protein [Bacteroidaceae bacterium]